MYSEDRARQLENLSKVRGLLNKEMYGYEQSEKQRKRRQQKQQLDKQVRERKMQQQRRRDQEQRKAKKEEEDIQKYWNSMSNRQKLQPTISKSNLNQEPNYISLMKDNQSNHQTASPQKNKGQTHQRKSVHYENIPEQIPVMGATDDERDNEQHQTPQQIPVLEINQDNRKRYKTKIKQSKRKDTHSRIDTLNSRKNTQSGGLRELQMQNQNKKLKEKLKKSQQAISLLISVIKTNPKLDKYRLQAERILQGSQLQSQFAKQPSPEVQRRTNRGRFFPTLSFNQRSVMKEYMISIAKVARKSAMSNRKLG